MDRRTSYNGAFLRHSRSFCETLKDRAAVYSSAVVAATAAAGCLRHEEDFHHPFQLSGWYKLYGKIPPVFQGLLGV